MNDLCEKQNAITDLFKGLAALPELIEANKALTQKVGQLEKRIGEIAPVKKRKFLNVKQAAEELNCSPKKIYELRARGLLKPSKASRHLLFPVEQIESFAARTI